MMSEHSPIHSSPSPRAQAALFLSHGSPMTALDGGAAGAFMRSLGPQLLQQHGRPRAILALSAHTLSPSAAHPLVLLAGPRHAAVYDFGGFDPRLRTLRYDAPGAPDLALEVQQLLHKAGWTVQRAETATGLDHGIWTPLRHAWPEADIPVLPMAWSPRMGPSELMRLGRDLTPLADAGVLILGSGSITHNLQLFMRNPQPMQAPERPESLAFRQWWAAHSEAADWPALQDWARQAPHGALMHPSDEHLLPYFVAAGVGQARGVPGRRVHDSAQHAVIGMDAYRFDPPARG